jgi:hypothetical protein
MLDMAQNPANKTQASASIATMKAGGRSKMTNARFAGRVTSRALFYDGDGRSPWSRRYRDLVALFADDAGGLETLTELKLALIRRCAALVCECERMENALADGEKVDVDLLARLSSHIRRVAESIGINRVKRDTVPTIDQLVARHRIDAKKAAEKHVERAEPVAATPAAPISSLPASDHASLAAAPIEEATA